MIPNTAPRFSYTTLPVEDELAIRNMLAKYVHLLDGCDAEGWANLFTEDGSWTRLNSPRRDLGGSGLPAETVSGRHNLLEMAVQVAQGRFKGLSRHQLTDVVVERGDGPDQARGWARGLITTWIDGPGVLAMVGNYAFEFARTTQGWRIRSIHCALVPR